MPLLPLPLTLTPRAGSSSQPSLLIVSAASAPEPRKPLWITACCCMCCQKGTECQESPKRPGPVTNDPDLLLLSFPEGAGNLRVPWLQGEPMNCSSSKPTSCCSTQPQQLPEVWHPPLPASSEINLHSYAFLGRKTLIVVERECSI